MALECEIKCTNCGNETKLVERTGWSELDIDSLEVGEKLKSMCMGNCDEAVTMHEVINIPD